MQQTLQPRDPGPALCRGGSLLPFPSGLAGPREFTVGTVLDGKALDPEGPLDIISPMRDLAPAAKKRAPLSNAPFRLH